MSQRITTIVTLARTLPPFPKSKSPLDAVRVSGIRKSTNREMMLATKRLIALGGPKNLEWLPDYDHNDILVPIPPDTRDLVMSYSTASDVMTMPVLKSARYVKELLGDPETGRVKNVYRYEQTSQRDADAILKNWLMAAFINMEE